MVNSGAVPQDRAQPAAAAFIGLLPALLFALVGARCAEWASSWPAGLALQDSLRFGAASALTDLLAFGRYLPLLWLALLPGLLCRGSRGQIITSSLVVGLLLLARGALSQYRITAGVTLGDDLFAYSWADIRQTTAETRPDPLLFLLLGALWVLVAAGVRRQLQRGTGYRGKTWAAGLLLACGVSWALAAAGWTGSLGDGSEHQRVLRQNSLASFVDSVAASATGKLHVQSPATTPASLQLLGRRVDDPAFPFLHVEHAPDVIGPLLDLPQDPPDVVVLIVEGLGRTFSGPGARLGSFTPHLDALGAEGLYWENFVAPQGRTFGVLPSLLGSMPFGEQGVLEMQPPAPRHDNLASLLGTLGHRSRFVCGFEGDFDHQRTYLQSSGFDQIIDRGRIATTAAIANSWGFDDDVVLQTALATRRAISQPGHFLDVIQTISMHTPFSVPDQPRWNARVDSRLAELGRTTQAARYAPHRAIYASILFTDDALHRYFESVRKDPAYAHTLFIVTGDHRLPELPMDDRLERYHVPLLIWSPLVRHPMRFKAVSSQFDVLPSLAALFATHYGLDRPARTAWVGDGLDIAAGFRNLRHIPLKQTKAGRADMLSGNAYLDGNRSYRVFDGLQPDGVPDASTQERLQSVLGAFLAANESFARTRSLGPTAKGTDASAAPVARSSALSIHGANIATGAVHARSVLDFTLTNDADADSVSVVPLAVVVDAGGREMGEHYGQAVSLAARETLALKIPLDTSGLSAGQYFVALFPSDPTSGKRIGTGQFHIPLVVPR